MTDSIVLKPLASPLGRNVKGPIATRYSDEQKIEAVKLWLVIGNTVQVAAALSIDVSTLKLWKSKEWWKDTVRELKTQTGVQLSNKLRVVATLALAQVEDRLEQGDWVYNPKTAKLQRKPVSLKDAHKVHVDLLDRSLRLADRPLEEEQNRKTIDKLNEIKLAFERFAKKSKNIEVTDVIFGEETNAVYDQRVEGLQAGEILGEEAQEWAEIN